VPIKLESNYSTSSPPSATLLDRASCFRYTRAVKPTAKVVLTVSEAKRYRGQWGEPVMRSESSEITNAELASFCRQFGTLMQADVNLLEALEALKSQSSKPMLKEIIDSIRHDVEMGRTLATSFSRYPTVFSPFFVSMVRHAEIEGELDETFLNLADHYASRLETGVDAGRRREAPLFDWESGLNVVRWMMCWSSLLLGAMAIAIAALYYATLTGAYKVDMFFFLAFLVIGVIFLLGAIVFATRRR